MPIPGERVGAIFLLEDGRASELPQLPYEAESVLQELIAEHPSILAGEQVDPASPRRWILVRREAGLPSGLDEADRWSVDHLLLDQDAVPTIVEVKRSSNTQIRREVVGQILDYAANAVTFWPIDRLRAWYEEGSGGGDQADTTLQESLGIELEVDDYWELAASNLAGGKLRLVFVADEIPVELRRIIEFLDGQMALTQVIGVEVVRYAAADERDRSVLVPRVVALSSRAQSRKGGAKKGEQWNEERFYAQLEQDHGPAEVAVVKRVEQWAEGWRLRRAFGAGVTKGSYYFVWDDPDTGLWHPTFSMWTNGKVGLELGTLKERAPFEPLAKRLELLRRINEIPGVVVPEEKVNVWPSIALALLVPGEALAQFTAVYDWVLAEFGAGRGGKGEPARLSEDN